MITNSITHEELLRRLHYDRTAGVFTWIVRTRKIRIGDIAGTIHPIYGYRQIRVDGKIYRASRLAWFYVTGEWPKDTIDHKDTDRANDAFDNLRPATQGENNWNMGLSVANSSGIKGVSFDRASGLWYAYIKKDNKMYNLGRYQSLAEAAEARSHKAKVLHGQFARDA